MTSKAQFNQAASVAMRAGRWIEAEQLLLEVLKLTPFDPDTLYNLGMAAHALGRDDDALRLWKQVLSAAPHHVAALANLGAVFFNRGQEEEGLRFTTLAVDRDPRNLTLLINLCSALLKLGNPVAALVRVEKSLVQYPRDPQLLTMQLGCLSQLDQHVQAHEKALQLLKMQYPACRMDALRVRSDSAAHLSDWASLSKHASELQEDVHPTMFSIDNPQQLFAARKPDQQVSVVRPSRTWRSGIITIGYLSPDFREHPVAQMLLDVVQGHDRSRFRVLLLNAVPFDDSPIAKALLLSSDGQVPLVDADTQEARARLSSNNVDVLVDLAGLSQGNRATLLQTRPCAAQILWLGWPATTGLGHYDAFLVDHVVAPPGCDAWYHEPLLRLPCCYHPISKGLHTGVSNVTRKDLGVPSDVFLIGLLQAPNRVRPPLIDVIIDTLAKFPSAHLLLRVRADSRPAVLAYMTAGGLPEHRVHFAPRFSSRDDYLHMIKQVDLYLDTHPYGGHSTSGEAMSLGVPVLTLAGRCMHARVAASMLHELGLGDLATHSLEEYRSTLRDLLGKSVLWMSWKERFAEAAKAPFQSRQRRLIDALEAAYEHVLSAALVK